MYNNPTVPKSTILLSRCRILKPCGPIIKPEIISPIKCGIFNLLSTIGANKIINNKIEKISTGFFNGSVISKILSSIIS
jgi:hypothetical protein